MTENKRLTAVAVICEYNPFHNGHKLQIDEIRQRIPNAYIIALMSGCFVQRGEFAVLPKYERAMAAVLCGADLVLELPYPYSCATAELFALGAIRTLKALNSVDVLCFGSECGDEKKLMETANRCMSCEFISRLNSRREEYKNSAESSIVSMSNVYKELYGEKMPVSSNDILALEYIKAMDKEDFRPKLLINKRLENFSATESRKLYKSESNELKIKVPKAAYEIYRQYKPVSLSAIEDYPLGMLKTVQPKSIGKYAELSGGLDARICNMAKSASTIEELYSLCATKKYTNAKIRRAVLNTVLKIQEKDQKEKPLYTQLLAMNEKGSKQFKKIVSASAIKIFTKSAHYKTCSKKLISVYEKMLVAERLYKLANIKSGNDISKQLKSPFILKSQEE